MLGLEQILGQEHSYLRHRQCQILVRKLGIGIHLRLGTTIGDPTGAKDGIMELHEPHLQEAKATEAGKCLLHREMTNKLHHQHLHPCSSQLQYHLLRYRNKLQHLQYLQFSQPGTP